MFSLLHARRARVVHGRSLVSGIAALGILFLVVPALAQNSEPDPPASLPTAPSATGYGHTSNPAGHPLTLTFAERARIYRRSVFSLDSIIEPAVGAGVGQAYNYPPEWHQGAEGYGKRFGSALA